MPRMPAATSFHGQEIVDTMTPGTGRARSLAHANDSLSSTVQAMWDLFPDTKPPLSG
jgi:hypothetical protein